MFSYLSENKLISENHSGRGVFNFLGHFDKHSCPTRESKAPVEKSPVFSPKNAFKIAFKRIDDHN